MEYEKIEYEFILRNGWRKLFDFRPLPHAMWIMEIPLSIDFMENKMLMKFDKVHFIYASLYLHEFTKLCTKYYGFDVEIYISIED